MTADYETGANANATNNPTDTKAQPVSQIVITRLILRIIPANSLPTQPASAPMRSGWFVIQL
jgi:hypothetical protein